MSKSWEGGSTTGWRKVRAFVLARDGYACRLRLGGCTGTATHVHHTQPRAVVGDDPAHLIAACARCNTSYGDPTDARHGNPAVERRSDW